MRFSQPQIQSFLIARSAVFAGQNLSLPIFQYLLTGASDFRTSDARKNLKPGLNSLSEILKLDAQNITEGIYPVDVLKPENPFKGLLNFPKIVLDGISISKRKRNNLTKEFPKEAELNLQEVPDYYKRNFHFQSGGYLTVESANLYDHQVEILFAGAADSMRRMLIKVWKDQNAFKTDSPHLLEIGCGTGRLTKFMKLAFPNARISAVDLSRPYLDKARKSLQGFSGVDFIQGDGAELPFKDQNFDGVYSCFLFHELPIQERKKVLSESLRVLKKNGAVGLVDSIQYGDFPEMDDSLDHFPMAFHEPFYKNYISNPLETLFKDSGFSKVKSATHFMSKVVTAVKV